MELQSIILSFQAERACKDITSKSLSIIEKILKDQNKFEEYTLYRKELLDLMNNRLREINELQDRVNAFTKGEIPQTDLRNEKI